MSNNKETELGKLEKLLKLGKLANKTMGVDVVKALDELKQKWFDEFRQTMPQQPPVTIDMDAITQKVIDALKAQQDVSIQNAVKNTMFQIANNLADGIEKLRDDVTLKINAIQSTGSSHDDIQKIIDSVGEMLKPVLIDQIQKSTENVMKANIQALQAEIYRKIDEKFSTVKTVSPPPENDDQDEQAPPQATNQGGNLFGGLGGLVNVVFAAAQEYPEGFKLITSLFTKTAPVSDPRAKLREVYDLSKIISGLKLDEPAADKLIDKLTDTPKA